MTKVLYSGNNTGGVMLEDHLKQIVEDMVEKTARVSSDTHPTAVAVTANNNAIITYLNECIRLQNDSLARLRELREDPKDLQNPGPTRVGMGSPGYEERARP